MCKACPVSDKKCKESERQANNIVVAALGDRDLHVARTVSDRPSEMLKKLDAGYRSRSAATKIGVLLELVSVEFIITDKSRSAHTDRLAGLLENLKGTDSDPMDSSAVVGLAASVQTSELMPTNAATDTLTEAVVEWEDVSRFLREGKGFVNIPGARQP